MVEGHERLRFGPLQVEMFAPLDPLLEDFALRYGLRLSRVFDGSDPVAPHCCYFLAWNPDVCRQCFLRICAEDPFKVTDCFMIGAQGTPLKQYNQWSYQMSQGPWAFENILTTAYQFVLQTVESALAASAAASIGESSRCDGGKPR